MICVLVMVIVFAMIGIFIGIAMGAQYINDMVSNKGVEFGEAVWFKKYRVKHHVERPSNNPNTSFEPSAPPEVVQMDVPNNFAKSSLRSDEMVQSLFLLTPVVDTKIV